MHADLILIILTAAVILAVVYRGLAWVYLPPRNLPGPAPDDTLHGAGEFHTDDRPPDTEPWGTCDWGDCEGWAEAWRWGHGHGWLPVCLRHTIEDDNWEPLPDSDDDWADQLHEINQLGKFGDLTRPVAHLTHYEVEALIRTLAVPEWVPDRYRMAA